ncbi:YeaH/YhbH family protein [Roseomonas elaeocarpi]|uniref:UPF0229 protein ACFFGY_03765 n=1 Tax=Roseomonas elaeocarpi TaxID=907779 RepID=A0ABV6JNQ4_9PROT
MDIIDRRPNPHGKNLENRRRVLSRARSAVVRAVREAVDGGTLREVGKEGEVVTIPAGTLHEPFFHTTFTSGTRELVLGGNREFSVGDRIKRPPGGAGGEGGAGSGAGNGDGQSEDNFRFVLSRDEFLELFFEDLELPDLVKSQVVDTETVTPMRTGISTDGAPSALDMGRTMRQSMARRIGLRRPKTDEIRALEAEIEALEGAGGDNAERLSILREELANMLRRLGRIAWVDPVDLRYRRFSPVPKPSARAVMFCLMDVSGSMTEAMKDLAKRFFLLLHVFLERRYQRVDLVFIRHTEQAEEVDEKTFFTDPRTGGTVVSSALAELLRIQRERYPADAWNIYAAQASDGDNYSGDTARTVGLLEGEILPIVQYFAYIEVGGSGALIRGESDLWRGYAPVAERVPQLQMRRVGERRDIFPVFRDLFGKRPATAAG